VPPVAGTAPLPPRARAAADAAAAAAAAAAADPEETAPPAASAPEIGWTLRNAPTAPRKPSCRRKSAAISPFDQKRMANEMVSIVYGWPRMKNPPKKTRRMP
jgi:hypothetical protein